MLQDANRCHRVVPCVHFVHHAYHAHIWYMHVRRDQGGAPHAPTVRRLAGTALVMKMPMNTPYRLSLHPWLCSYASRTLTICSQQRSNLELRTLRLSPLAFISSCLPAQVSQCPPIPVGIAMQAHLQDMGHSHDDCSWSVLGAFPNSSSCQEE